MSEVPDAVTPHSGSLETCRAFLLLALTEEGAPTLSGHGEPPCSARDSPPKIRQLHPNAKAPLRDLPKGALVAAQGPKATLGL